VLHHPIWLEGETETHRVLLLDQHLVPVHLKELALLLELGTDFPLRARVVHDGNVLSDDTSCGNSELKLSLDLLRDGGQLVFVQANVSPVD